MTSDLAPILRALADGERIGSEEIRAALDDAETTDALVELARRMDGLRQRAAELRAVMSSTKDLLSTTDADMLLQRIVDRAHELIDVDITYLSVYEPARDELYVRAVSGTTSPRFLAMVVPAGVGLASLAVRTRHPQWVEDYESLATVPHDPTIDAIVREEDLRSLLGAPLVVGDRVLGVLFAASREPRAFRADKVALLSAFAGHAALVLHLAQLLAEATEATADAANRQRQAEWAAAVHEELTRLVVFGHGADAVVGALAEALDRRVLFVDGDGALISASARPAGEEAHTAVRARVEAREGLGGDASDRDAPGHDIPAQDTPDARVRAALRTAGEEGRSVILDRGRIELVAPVLGVTGRPGGLLVERGERALTDVERRTVERSALIAALLMLRRDALADAEERVRGEIAAELLGGPERRISGLQRAHARGYPADTPWTVVAVPAEADADVRARLLALLRRRGDWLSAPHDAGVTVLLPSSDSRAVPADEVRVLVEAPLVVTASHPDLGSAADAAPELWRATRLARGLGIRSGAVRLDALAPYALLFDGDGRRAAAFVDEMIGPVRSWDASRGTDLVGTLAALADHRWSAQAAARGLHVHLNTVKQRMQRLRDLLGAAIDEPESRFRVELAVRIERMRRQAEQDR